MTILKILKKLINIIFLSNNRRWNKIDRKLKNYLINNLEDMKSSIELGDENNHIKLKKYLSNVVVDTPKYINFSTWFCTWVSYYFEKFRLSFSTSNRCYYTYLKIIHFNNKGWILYKLSKRIIKNKKLESGRNRNFYFKHYFKDGAVSWEVEELKFQFFKNKSLFSSTKNWNDIYLHYEKTFLVELTRKNKKFIKNILEIHDLLCLEFNDVISIYPMSIPWYDIELLSSFYSESVINKLKNSEKNLWDNNYIIFDITIPNDFFNCMHYDFSLHEIWTKMNFKIEEIRNKRIQFWILMFSCFSAFTSLISFFK